VICDIPVDSDRFSYLKTPCMSTTLDNPNAPAEVPYRPVAVRGGLITALILIAFGLVLQVTGISDPANPNATANIVSTLVSIVILTGGIVWVLRTHKADQNGYLTFGRGLTAGMMVSVIVGLVTLVWMIVNFMFIQPEMIEVMQETAREQMYERQPNITDEQVDQAMGFMSFMFNPFVLGVIGLVTTLIQGLIISLIVSAVVKNNPPEVN
jgi:hypothetical protein